MVLAIALLAQSAGVERGREREREKEGEREYKKNNFNNSKTKKKELFHEMGQHSGYGCIGCSLAETRGQLVLQP